MMKKAVWASLMVGTLSMGAYAQTQSQSVRNVAQVKELAKSGQLVRVSEGDGYVFSSILRGEPYLRPYAKQFLDWISGKYADACKGPFTITDMLTPEDSIAGLQPERKYIRQAFGASFSIKKDACPGGEKLMTDLVKSLHDCSEMIDFGNEYQISGWPNFVIDKGIAKCNVK